MQRNMATKRIAWSIVVGLGFLATGCGGTNLEANTLATTMSTTNSVSQLAINDNGAVRSTVNFGAVNVEPGRAQTKFTSADANSLLKDSGALEAVQDGSPSPVTTADAYQGLVSDLGMQTVKGPAGMAPAPADVSPVPQPTRAVAAVVVVFRSVAWVGLHQGRAAASDGKDYSGPNYRRDVVVAFDAESGKFLFLRTVA